MAIQIINSIIDSINALPVGGIVFWGQLIGGALSVFLLGLIIMVSAKMAQKKRLKLFEAKIGEAGVIPINVLHKEETSKAWKDVLAKIYSHNASDWLLAVIQADAIFDDILKRMGIAGESMGERLQQLDVSKLNSLNDVWEAHKIRNRVAHTPATLLRHDELLAAVEKYKKALKELEYIE